MLTHWGKPSTHPTSRQQQPVFTGMSSQADLMHKYLFDATHPRLIEGCALNENPSSSFLFAWRGSRARYAKINPNNE